MVAFNITGSDPAKRDMGANGNTGSVRASGEGGFAGTHPRAAINPILVGPTTTTEHNFVNTNLIPVACWRVEDIRFEFDSSFVRPEIAAEIGQLADLRDQHKRGVKSTPGGETISLFPPLSIFGHADPVGNDEYNKTLSGRRAIAIYGLLTRNTDLWEQLHKLPQGNDTWSTKADPIIEETLNLPSGALKDSASRPGHFRTYMDRLCALQDQNSQPLKDAAGNPVVFQLDSKEDFLARGADPAGKGDHQGCGEFNPALLFSKEEDQAFAAAEDKTERNAANAPNRRVIILLFRPGTRVTPAKWPCPRSNADGSGCKKRFWSDGEQRRSSRLSGEGREFKKTQDTFACRFYQRLTDKSPCERLTRGLATYHITHELDGTSVANTLFEIRFPDGSVKRLRSDDEGVIRIAGVEGQEFTMVAIDDDKNPGSLKNQDGRETGKT